ncbi:MAG TPA: lycopene cyclase domain-containing protein [Nocardioidaceae bacterium]|nr:lycopene cyclase domain-containing protein [Nocardioidaceae bacterium]
MTYADLAALFLAVSALVTVAAGVLTRPSRGWWWSSAVAAVVLCVLTALFDSLMIAADLFRYDTSALLGARVLLVPVEDFAWPVAAVLLLPALWELLGPARRPSTEVRG